MPKTFVRPRGGVILRHPETGAPAVPDPAQPYSSDDPLVKAYPWAFASDEEIAEEQERVRSVTSVDVEDVTARPGQKRSTKRQ